MADTITTLITKPFVMGPIIALFVFAAFGAIFSNAYLDETQDLEDQIALRKKGVLTIKGSIADAELHVGSLRGLKSEVVNLKASLREKEEAEKIQKGTIAVDIKRIVDESEIVRNKFIAYHKKFRDIECKKVIGMKFAQLNIKGVGPRKKIQVEKIDIKRTRVFFSYAWAGGRMKHDVLVSSFPPEFQDQLQLQLPHALQEPIAAVKAQAPKLQMPFRQMPFRAAPQLVQQAKQLQRAKLLRRKNDISGEAKKLQSGLARAQKKFLENEDKIQHFKREADERLSGDETDLRRERGHKYAQEAQKLEQINEGICDNINEAKQRLGNLRQENESIDRQLKDL